MDSRQVTEHTHTRVCVCMKLNYLVARLKLALHCKSTTLQLKKIVLNQFTLG